jgi:hypothetical protein
MSYDPDTSRHSADWLETDEGERIELVSSYHRRKNIRLPNAQLHAALVLVALAAASIAAVQPVPFELSRLIAKARLDGPVTAWCRGEFRAGRRRAFAVAVTSAAGGGRYLVLESDATITELASFRRSADLSCHTRAEAQKLDLVISRSETIHGHITPRWSTAVVCAFVDETTSACWQYSPADRAFVEVGGWIT